MNLNLFFFAALYFVQGAALAYVVNFQKPYLLVQGIDKTTMGIFTGLLLVPFILKVFLGLLSDRVPLGRFGSRRPYMVIGLLLFAASYASISQVEPGKHFFIFASLSFIASLGLALFDTCADGWAIDVASREDESRTRVEEQDPDRRQRGKFQVRIGPAVHQALRTPQKMPRP